MDGQARFMVDHMLIRLGKYLRILGYDAEWDPFAGTERATRTHELIRKANEDGRIFLTRNTRLPDQYPKPARMIAVTGEEPARQLEAVVRELGLDTSQWLFSRCIQCNVALQAVADKKSIEGRVHPNVYARHEAFYACPSCGTVFWKGSHVRNTCAKLGLADSSDRPAGGG